MKYECHITIDPVEGAALQLFEDSCADFHFKVAKLIKVNGLPSDRDQFATGHGVQYLELHVRMSLLCRMLVRHGFRIRRYKIEEVLLDSREADEIQVIWRSAP